MGVDTKGMSDMEAGAAAIDAVVALIGKLGIPTKLSEVGVPEDGLVQVAELALSDGAIVYNPKMITEADEILGVLKEAY
jgi:alcohol dehydrogenase